MTLSMRELAGLGDHLPIGPQVVPHTQNGVAIVQRGPHGVRFAPPISTGPGGVRWWSEIEDAKANKQYVPQETIVGVMGLGATSDPDATTIAVFRSEIQTAKQYLDRGDTRAASMFAERARVALSRMSAKNAEAYGGELAFVNAQIAGTVPRDEVLTRAQRAEIDRQAAAEKTRNTGSTLRNLPGALWDRTKELVGEIPWWVKAGAGGLALVMVAGPAIGGTAGSFVGNTVGSLFRRKNPGRRARRRSRR